MECQVDATWTIVENIQHFASCSEEKDVGHISAARNQTDWACRLAWTGATRLPFLDGLILYDI